MRPLTKITNAIRVATACSRMKSAATERAERAKLPTATATA